MLKWLSLISLSYIICNSQENLVELTFKRCPEPIHYHYCHCYHLCTTTMIFSWICVITSSLVFPLCLFPIESDFFSPKKSKGSFKKQRWILITILAYLFPFRIKSKDLPMTYKTQYCHTRSCHCYLPFMSYNSPLLFLLWNPWLTHYFKNMSEMCQSHNFCYILYLAWASLVIQW